MTSVEMMQEFNRLARDKYKLYEVSDRLNPIDIEGYLNESKDRMLFEKFLSYGSPYENIIALQRGYDEISSLVKVDTSVGVTGASNSLLNNTDKIDSLPSDYLYYVNSSSEVTRDKIITADSEWVSNIEVSYSAFRNVSTGVFNYPIIRKPLVYYNEDSIYLIYDAYTTINDVALAYLKRPDDIDIKNDTTTDIPEHWHHSIIENAVLMYLGNIASQNTQNRQEDSG